MCQRTLTTQFHYFCTMTKKQAWLEAIRPRTLPLSLAGIIMGTAIAFAQGHIDWLIFTLALLTTIAFQVLSNLANDLGDGMKGTDNEDRIGPVRAIQSGVISQAEMKRAVTACAIISAVLSATLIWLGTRNMPVEMIVYYSILAVLCIAAAITYTVGKRAYGYLGLGDLMVFVFFGLVSVLGVYSLYTNLFDAWNILPAAALGLLSTAVLNLNNMRDYASDSKAQKNTLVVQMGINAAKLYHSLLVLVGLVCQTVFISHLHSPVLYASLLPGILLLLHVRKVMQTKHPKEFDPELKKVALATFALAVLFFALIWVR